MNAARCGYEGQVECQLAQTANGVLEQVLRYPGVPSHWRTRELGGEPPPILTIVFRKGERRLRFFSTITTLGTARDVTLDELRIECAARLT